MQSNLTINDLRSIVEGQTEYVVSDRLYYKKFAYNVTMKNSSLWSKEYWGRSNFYSIFNDTEAINAHKEKFAFHYSKQKRIMQLMDRLDIEYRVRRELNFNIYLNDNKIIKRMLDTIPEEIISVSGPKNDQHLNILNGGRKIIVRESLFYKKYRYKISYYATSDFKENIFPAIENLLPSLDYDQVKLSSNYYRLRRQIDLKSRIIGNRYQLRRTVDPWHLVTIYFKDEDDIVMFKMCVGGDPKQELEIMLHDELQTDK